MRKKCKTGFCFEPADCRHGYCRKHCYSRNCGRLRNYSESESPSASRLYVGVELECRFPDGFAVERACARQKGHYDCSTGEYGAEFKLLRTDSRITKAAQRMAQDLWECGARASTRCGLHVHIDARSMLSSHVRKLSAWANDVESDFFALMPRSRQDNNYCRKLYGDIIPNRWHLDHPTWLVRTRHNTIECRLHGSTLNPYKVSAWVDCWRHIRALVVSDDDMPPDFQSFLSGAPAHVSEYLIARRRAGGSLADVAFRCVEE